MWTRQQRDTLSIIYGDDLLTVGNVVVARDEEKKKCRIITDEGEDLLGRDVCGVGMFLGTGGFHYLVVTDIVEKSETSRRHVVPSYRNRWGIPVAPSIGLSERHSKEYKYEIFNSNFEYEFVGSVKGDVGSFANSFCVEVGKRFYTVNLRDCIIEEQRSYMAY